MGWFDDETMVTTDETAAADGVWSTVPSSRWNIGDTANGGYAVSSVLRAMRAATGQPDPWSVTTHYLAPLRPDGREARIEVEMVKAGRTASVASGRLGHDGRERLRVMAAFGDLSVPASSATVGIDPPAPPIPGPDECVDRSELVQGVELPILERLEVRIHPGRAVDGGSDEAVMEGWIRFIDGTAPSTLSLPLFADAFPPSLYARFGRVGWVPTLELTVHVRRHPAAGWIRARFECDDLDGGRMMETGTLWDETGAVVARSRQLGLLLA